MSESLMLQGVSLRSDSGITLLLDRTDFNLCSGEIVGLVGLTGCGKSSFGRMLKGFVEPNTGQIGLASDTQIILPLKASERMNLIGWTPPHPETAIFANTVHEEIAFGLRNQKKAEEQVDTRVRESARMLELPEDLLTQSPYDLSGGEKRRVALASITAMDYKFYIFDEPTAGLDYIGVKAFMATLVSLQQEGRGIIWIGHDLAAMRLVVNRFSLLERGKFREPSEYLERYEFC